MSDKADAAFIEAWEKNEADHGISPAQLREKVEALEKRHENAIKMCAALDDIYRDAIDDAMKRIVELERQVARLTAQQTAWRGVNRYEAPIDREDV